MDIDQLFKGSKVALGGNKRKMTANPTPEMLKRMKINAESTSTNGGSSSSAKPISRPVTVRDEEEDDAAQNFVPGGDADYYVEEDDEGGRFFGGGLTDEQKTILNIFDRAGGEAVQDEEVCELHRSGSCGVVAGTGYLTILHTQAPELNTVGVRKLLSKLEKAVAKNQDQRSKYPNAPEKYSEADLDAAIKALLPLAQVPTVSYPELIKSGATLLLVGLLSHENMDIVIDVVEVIHEFTDEDAGGEDDDEEEDEDGQVIRKSEEALKALIDSLVTNQTLELLVQNLARMDEKEETDRQGVFHTLGIFENVLASRPTLAETLVSTTTIMQWLLSRIIQKEHDDNRGYAAEVLAILVQSSRSNRLVLVKAEGVDTILRALSIFRRRDPSGPDETEFMENIFDALCSSLAEPEVRESFQQAEGVDLMVLIMKENRASKSRAIKVLDYALSGPLGATNCVTFVEAMGLKSLFSAFMGKNSKKVKAGTAMPASEDIGHILGVISSLFANLDSDSPPRIRVLAKFVEAEYEKIDRLVELREQAETRLKIADREIRAEKKELLAAGEDPGNTEDLFLLRRLDGGLFTLQTIDVLLAWVIMEDDGVKQHVEMLFGRRGKSIKDIQAVLKGYLDNIGEAEAEDDSSEALASSAQRNILNGLIGFLEGC
ncbi:Beta-catenin-like protein 1 [Ceratobasidium theobromae]|uniref:Beta-catenin-like protein 1 n=1 Tax=Ceratobasidium theobromae TaxID=1582974 RepID=A0A5N5QUM7_9AGAM|nr:Beta-catenin-like protein 1 [Ceratobasidium theobromae]